MLRLVGIDLPEKKRIEVALTYIYGVGPHLAKSVLTVTKINPDTRAKDLTATDVAKLQKALESHKVEGDLRKEIRENIQRLKRVGSYRGHRHAVGLPVHGQRTRTNARTLRGKRKTIGAMKKEDAAKVATPEGQ
ncbi:MAG: Ribosomal protein S13 [Microgenomates group bacterium GW2011_GWC1_46_16]|uniref:Small ribosomal subunit protein uS13 n=2 Tax=Candidatus Collieribacteriota TaxID=1752725 RepID=A0A1F5FXF9_9BACT|nr:MAG: Ribosomal protein S13 [Microgenomates group bacterium GW2011_GWF1_46_12]KKU26873.1 MAG: Ribosomal protein S13 [Microgenomates group bacterium GW2011_GWC1_46_16]KKU28289.1 MAG: Ribosomal protein S13 [Microgenomates group bacterium GW2011_GWF2_46_18]KKU44134.1 MAG: Ribosomal protein S13 [Microgenomates group bacterium GW2011_GWA1_46_7]KKU45512.1 MAG: Ribosomal protein S13 [Microgenomates group bacterium GW2011_GWB1_46_7]KKU62106.1 MAG: Ribosomal protein S13 [Microgenomates group bacteriu